MRASSLGHQARLCLLAASPVWEIPSFSEHSWGNSFFWVFETPPSPAAAVPVWIRWVGKECSSRSHPRVPRGLVLPSWSPTGSGVPGMLHSLELCEGRGSLLAAGMAPVPHTAWRQVSTACSPLQQHPALHPHRLQLQIPTAAALEQPDQSADSFSGSGLNGYLKTTTKQRKPTSFLFLKQIFFSSLE